MIRRRTSLIHKYMLGNLCILAFALIGALFVNSYYSKIVREQAELHNEVVLRQAQEILDQRFILVDKMMLEAAFDTSALNYLYSNHKVSDRYYYQMYMAIKSLSTSMVHTSDRSLVFEPIQVYLYHAGNDTVVDAKSKYDAEYFFDHVANYTEIDAGRWREIQLGSGFQTYLPAQTVIMEGEEKQAITRLASMPLVPSGRKIGSVGFILDVQVFTSVLEGSIVGTGGLALILDKNGTALLSTGNIALLEHDYEQRSEGYRYDHIGGMEVIVTCVPSAATGFTYFSVMPTAVFMNRINSIRAITAMFLGLILVLGIVLSWLLARSNYSPVKKLLLSLQNMRHSDDAQKSCGNELDYIEKTALSVQAEIDGAKQALEDYLPLLQNSLLMQLLLGESLPDHPTAVSLATAGFILNKRCFCIAVADVRVPGRNSEQVDLTIAKFVSTNVLNELLCEHETAYMINISIDKLAILINFEGDKQELYAWLAQQFEQARNFLRKNYSVSMNFGVGRARQGLKSVHISYTEALMAQEYSMYNAQSPIVFSHDMHTASRIYSYPLKTEMQLMASVKTGDKQKMNALLDDIIELNYRQGDLSLELARCLFFDLMSTAVKTMNELEAAELRFESINLLTSCKSIDTMESALRDMFGRMCDIACKKQTSHNERMKRSITQYIEQNFANPDLSLSSVAEAFYISPAYLSRFLKEYAGINFLDYLRNVRIDHANKYLAKTDIPIIDIAARVGYTSSIVFIRNFKKVCHVTPGQMRAQDATGKDEPG